MIINKAIETIRNNNTRKYIRILAGGEDNLGVCWLNLYNILADYTYVMFLLAKSIQYLCQLK